MSLLARLLFFTTVLTSCCVAQDIVDLEHGSVGAYLTLKQLRTTGSLLQVVAHPDDEDGALLAYCARGLGVRTMLFSITRGEGGANLISDHFFDELGVLRTLEHQKAASYYGNELFYSRAADYGFSKTLAEAMRQWSDGRPILSDLVEVIRRERPAVIVSRFHGDARDGHGHHQMAGVLSRLAFDAAADPTQFPEQLERGLLPWRAKKLFIAQRRYRPSNESVGQVVAVPTGTFDPMIGRSYSQIARFGLGFQRSQGISGHDGEAGPQTSYLLLESEAKEDAVPGDDISLFDDIETRLAGLVGQTDAPERLRVKSILEDVDRGIDKVWDEWQARAPHRSAASLAVTLNRLREIDIVNLRSSPDTELQLLAAQLKRTSALLQRAIVECLGIELECWASHVGGASLDHATPGAKLQVYVRLVNQNAEFKAELLSLEANGTSQTSIPADTIVEPASIFESKFPISLSEADVTRPYWSRVSMREPLYTVSADGDQNPEPAPTLRVAATLQVVGTSVQLPAVVETRRNDPDFGSVRYPLTVVPKLSIGFPLSESVLPVSNDSYKLSVLVRNSTSEQVTGEVKLELPDGWTSEPRAAEIKFQREGEEATFAFEIHPSSGANGEYLIRAVATSLDREYREGYRVVTARDLGRMSVYRPAEHRVRISDIRLEGEPRVGYISGSGDQVAESLGAIGVEPSILSTSDLATSDLGRYDVIVVGVRAYAVRKDVRKYNARLLEFARRGGVLIVQYQTPEFDANFGPFPYEMGRRPEEVSEEDAEVTILRSNHVLLREPNRITNADFGGWVEQRGSKFWSSWDERYLPLLACHDAGQEDQRGGMLFARYGEGAYIYTAYAWYRQLPSGIPGAYRIFANMLSLPETMDR